MPPCSVIIVYDEVGSARTRSTASGQTNNVNVLMPNKESDEDIRRCQSPIVVAFNSCILVAFPGHWSCRFRRLYGQIEGFARNHRRRGLCWRRCGIFLCYGLSQPALGRSKQSRCQIPVRMFWNASSTLLASRAEVSMKDRLLSPRMR